MNKNKVRRKAFIQSFERKVAVMKNKDEIAVIILGRGREKSSAFHKNMFFSFFNFVAYPVLPSITTHTYMALRCKIPNIYFQKYISYI